MKDWRAICGAKLAATQGVSPALREWSRIDWRRSNAQTVADPVREAESSFQITTYPNLEQMNEAEGCQAVLRCFGKLLEREFSDLQKKIWSMRLALPKGDQVKAFNRRLASGDFGTYREIVDSFDDPIDRLVALNLANGLIANKVSRPNARRIDVTRWTSTQRYAQGGAYHSLIPLVSAYCPESYACFGTVLGSMVIGQFQDVYHTAIRSELSELVARVLSS